jgi:hypothetical protein
MPGGPMSRQMWRVPGQLKLLATRENVVKHIGRKEERESPGEQRARDLIRAMA